MPRQPIIELCRKDMFTAEDELLQKYNPEQAQRLVRLRDMYTWYLSNPDSKDRQFIDMAASRHGLSKPFCLSLPLPLAISTVTVTTK